MRRRQRCLELVELVTERPSAYVPLLRRMGGLKALLSQRVLELDAEPATDPSSAAVARVRGARRAAPVQPGSPTQDGAREDGGDGACCVDWTRDPGPDRLVVTYVDEDYPPQLADLFDPPPALFVAGARTTEALKLLAHIPLVAVVGTRAPSRYGREMAGAVARGLAQAGVCVVSGLALGIDALAHKAALEATSAPLPTVAVRGCGADVAYPRTNLRLYDEIVSRGLIVSEYPWDTPTRPWRFPARNRIIAALCRAVVVVEGAADSGSLITTDHALDVSRAVFAVPGEAGRRLSAAPHGLLRSGAHLCESAGDVLSLLGLEQGGPAWSQRRLPDPATPEGKDGTRAALLRALDDGEGDIDVLTVRVGLPAATVLATLGALEVEGIVSALGGRYRLVRGA